MNTSAPQNCIVFQSDAFNTSTPKEYFINDCCYGDDLARWMMGQLQARSYQTSDEPGQEDFGWYFTFEAAGEKHDVVLGFRESDEGKGDWICTIEKKAGLVGSIFGKRKNIDPQAIGILHAVLSASPLISNPRVCNDREA